MGRSHYYPQRGLTACPVLYAPKKIFKLLINPKGLRKKDINALGLGLRAPKARKKQEPLKEKKLNQLSSVLMLQYQRLRSPIGTAPKIAKRF